MLGDSCWVGSLGPRAPAWRHVTLVNDDGLMVLPARIEARMDLPEQTNYGPKASEDGQIEPEY